MCPTIALEGFTIKCYFKNLNTLSIQMPKQHCPKSKYSASVIKRKRVDVNKICAINAHNLIKQSTK